MCVFAEREDMHLERGGGGVAGSPGITLCAAPYHSLMLQQLQTSTLGRAGGCCLTFPCRTFPSTYYVALECSYVVLASSIGPVEAPNLQRVI